MWCKPQDPKVNNEQVVVPLQNVKFSGIIEGGHATLNAQLSYMNHFLDEQNPIECTFQFPLDAATVVTKLVATINDKTIEAQIKEKQQAKEKYDDAVAAGNTAIFAEKTTKKTQDLTLLIGNLGPG